MPEQEREEAVGSYSEILSNKAFVKCSQSLCPTDFHHTVQITCVHSRLDYIGMMVIGINCFFVRPERAGCRAWW